jgi:hypothetical protein
MMRLFPHKALLICAALGFAACKAQSGTVLEIVDVPQVETDCTLASAPSHFQARGLYDPADGVTYLQLIFLQNNAQESTATLAGGITVNANANDAIIIGYDTCFYRADDPHVVAWKPGGKGLIIDCDKTPSNQRLFIPSSGSVASAGGTLAAFFDVFGDAQLRSLYGQDWDSTALTGFGDNTTTRGAGWGDFPAAASSEVVLQFRARANDQGGHLMRSNWFAFPIVIEPNFSEPQNACGAGQTYSTSSCVVSSGQPFTCQAAVEAAGVSSATSVR